MLKMQSSARRKAYIGDEAPDGHLPQDPLARS